MYPAWTSRPCGRQDILAWYGEGFQHGSALPGVRTIALDVSAAELNLLGVRVFPRGLRQLQVEQVLVGQKV